ncbi:hypothetical protein C9374_000360 [Naegleria lovaniensis]|uniref:Fatty acid desaturase domain-containing protein n=1 Tax=Naegleria lovaniensis TaxID=51637 RepID=A0AA88GV14_NAELO|nr:uncharacterized protein C9374_000360 [Naegleria lovaniensis]KAG2388921.1 hypothetical protein C9374_000360 [Naegleria lovaniensis]
MAVTCTTIKSSQLREEKRDCAKIAPATPSSHDVAVTKSPLKTPFRAIHDNADIVETTPENPWRPYPWCLWPDWFSGVLGLSIMAPLTPPVVVLLTLSNVWMALIKNSWSLFLSRVPLIRSIPDLVYEKFAKFAAKKIMNNEKNSEFIPSLLWLTVLCPTILGVALYRFYHYGFEFWFFFLYHLLRLGPRFRFFTHLHVLLHKEGHDHDGFFNNKTFLHHLNHWYVQWFLGPFYGQVPNSYCIGHNKIHHKFDNGLDDVHTNIDLDRTKSWSFIMYAPRFGSYWVGTSCFFHFLIHGEYKFAWGILKGMIVYYGLWMLSYYTMGFTFTFAYLVLPQLEAIVFFAAISYMWHLWIEPKDPTNPYINSVTIVNGHDNVWGEDYHAIHHHAVSVHWRDADAHYVQHEQEYADNQATMFTDCEEGVLLYWIFSQQWDEVAKHFVDKTGKMTLDEKKELVLKRARCTFGKKTQYGWKHMFQFFLGKLKSQ